MRQTIINYKINKLIKMFGMICVLLSFVTFMSACNRKTDIGVIVAGSTSVQPYAEVLAEEYMILNPGSVIDIQGGGSSAGITAARTGVADIGMSSRTLNDEEQDMKYVEIARDGLVIIVNPDNPIDNLTLEQIRDIYSAVVTDWSQLGGFNSKIHLIAREEGSGTRSAFSELVMGSSEITPKAIVQDSNGAVKQVVAGDKNAIGFISLGLVDETTKALQLDGVKASGENILNNSYTLARPFLFVTQSEPTGQTKKFIDFVHSPEGQKLLIDEGLVPSVMQ